MSLVSNNLSNPVITGRLKNVLKMSLKSYNSLKDVFSMLWMSQRRLLYVMDVSKTSFVRYECLKDIFCALWMSQRLFCTLWMSQRRLSYVVDVSKTSFVRYGCLKDVPETACIHWEHEFFTLRLR